MSNQSKIEATFEDIIQKARQIKERKFRERWNTIYSATGCGIGALGTFMVIVFLAYQSSWIRSTTNHIYYACCRGKERRDKGTTLYPSQENKSASDEATDKQSASTLADTRQENDDHKKLKRQKKKIVSDQFQ